MAVVNKGYAGFVTTYNADTLSNAVHYVGGLYAELGQEVPTTAGLARYLKCCRATLNAWRKVHPPFNDIMEEMSAEQELKLINGGLSSKYNYAITKLMLARHGYHDKVDSDLTSGGETITKIQIVALDDSSADKTTT